VDALDGEEVEVCPTLSRNARAPSSFMIFPPSAALTSPARGTFFLLIVNVTIRG
jgi:hypothetical protein